MSRSPDAELMRRVRSGDHDAFAGLVDRHKDAVVGYLCRLTGCRDRAEELAQDAFLRLYQSAGRYRENGHLKAYLFRIATNLVRSDARRQRRRSMLAGFMADASPDGAGIPAAAGAAPSRVNGYEFAADGGPSPQDDAERSELTGRLAEEIARLPLRYKVPLVLHDIEEWTYDEIARSTGAKQGTVKSRISRGRKLLRERLEPLVNGVHR